MRKLIACLLVALLAVPSMAAVSFSLVDGADGTMIVKLNTNGEAISGVALDVVVTGDGLASTNTVVFDSNFNVFMDTAFDIGEGYALNQGDPLAKAGANPGAFGYDSKNFAISMGYLDQDGDEVKGEGYVTDGEVVLCQVYVGAGNVTVKADTARGPESGVVGPAAVSSNLDGGATLTVAVTEAPATCIAPSHPDFAEWDALGQPASWCNPRQCYGDADEDDEEIGKGTYFVGYSDISILLDGFKEEYVEGDTWIAADFDRRSEEIGKGTYRVGYEDISILLDYFKEDVVPTDCND